ncbi:MAG: molybdenum cofactor biosynthesis protein MoaE [Ectothiorhodospiraceae bacterium]|nr:molybdenum cofactor biosynthesis protein MoaE [Ectothiorhodospiraceae bacterium]
MQWMTEDPLDLDALLQETEDDACGALVVFAGTVRNHHEGKGVSGMSYSAYKPMADRVLKELEQETLERFPVEQCRIMHRTGNLAIGEASVLVVVRSHHRADAFDAARYAIDTLKVRLPVWKHDEYTDGTRAYQDGVPLQEPGAVPGENRDQE